MKIEAMIQSNSTHSFTVDEIDAGERIDKVLSIVFENYSRSFLQKLFKNQNITVNNVPAKPSLATRAGDLVSVHFPEAEQRSAITLPDDMKIEIVAQENDFFIINKPATILTHAPNHTCQEATVSDWVIQHEQEIGHVGAVDRPGIVHRLDRDTSGLMIIPRTNEAHQIFSDMFKARTIQKTYLALVKGNPETVSGTIDLYIDRHPSLRYKMHAFTDMNKRKSSRNATTHYKVLQDFDTFSLVEIKPTTGRTHQIRVHFTAIGHPLLGDSLYGEKSKLIPYHALHAHRLEFTYKNKQYSFERPLPQKMQLLVEQESRD
jgi:23S rRNA pseudouridine1911/1915/1917 synthase